MVRFIIVDNTIERTQFLVIYIPIWLDLLSKAGCFRQRALPHLHSNMVRFIIDECKGLLYIAIAFTFQYG